MRLRILIVLFIALPFVIYGQKTPEIFVSEVLVLDEYAQNGTMIADNALILTANGFLGEGDIGFVYAGRLADNKYPVAIKFFPERHDSGAANELNAYREMEAYRNPNVENLGIPVLHHFGKWKHQEKQFKFIAITKLHESLDDVKKRKAIYPLDIMILFKHFVIQSRYMHSHRVHHGDLDSSNVMVRFHQSFIIDFNQAQIMEEEDTFLLTHQDWIGFVYTILELCDIGVPGSWDTWKEMLPGKIPDPELLSVIKEFGDEAFSSNHSRQFPNYDGLETFIDKEIKKYGRRTNLQLMFSWFANR